jgi:3-hydroxyisobutyrate dehydrogenase-like beta-hydroxyacid dehydrogenase
MHVAVVGLGDIGRAIAQNLLKAGHHVTVWNRSPQKAEALVAQGATLAKSPREAFQHAEVVLSLLFDDEAVQQVILDGDTLAGSPATHVCMSTISTEMVQKLAAEHARHGSGFASAPVFGRPEAAAASQLQIAIAGPDDVVARVEPVLALLGRTWRVGTEPHHAVLAKLGGNFLIGAALGALSEACALIAGQGGDPRPAMHLLTETLFSAPIYKATAPIVAALQAPPRASAGSAIPQKDIGLYLAEAKRSGIEPRFARLIEEGIGQALERHPKDDMAVAVAKVARERAR